MKVFNEECPRPNTFIVVLDKEEAQKLLWIANAACAANPRRRAWAAMRDALEKKLCCF